MTTKLLTTDIWPTLAAAAKNSSGPSDGAVAYFGSSGSALLPLSEGSRLVVDASDQTIKCGQTNPHELAKMLKKGVRIFSVPNLHAKIFVFGRSAYIGSANVSKHSESTLVEAVIRTTDPEAVRAAKKFIVSLCINPIGPRSIGRLKRLYRPPRFLGVGKRKTVLPSDRLTIVQLTVEDVPKGHEGIVAIGDRKAKAKIVDVESFAEECFWHSRYRFDPGERVVQVTTDRYGRSLVSAPGTVIHGEIANNRKSLYFTWLEVPNRRRISADLLARKLGVDAAKYLKRSGLIRNAEFKRKLLAAF